MDTTYNYNEELGLLRRAVGEPVRQLIIVEYDVLDRLHQSLHELAALDPKRAQVIHKFDFLKDAAGGLLQIIRKKLEAAPGSRPAFLALVGAAQIEEAPGAPASERFWKEMNQAREALSVLDAQILLCLERWSFRQALAYADHLLSWAGMKIHLISSTDRPMATDRTALSTGLFGDYKISPDVARERWQELEQSWQKAQAAGEPAGSFLERFFIPMLEAALSLGDLVLARKTRELAREYGQFPDEAMPRWHELNLALALAEHETDLANEHAYKLLDLAENHSDERIRERALVAVNAQAKLLTEIAKYELAEPLYRKSLQLAEKTFGTEHPKVATRLNNLAQLLKETNRIIEAEQLMRRALAVDEGNFGPDGLDVARDLNNLAVLLRDTNRLTEAEPLLRRALAITEKSAGQNHPKVAIRLNNLALLLQDTNRLAEAEPLLYRALAIVEKSFGPDHPNVGTALSNVARLLHGTNRPTEAEPLMRRTLAISEKCFGPDHPDVAIRLNNLAHLLKNTNRLIEAEPLIRRAFAILVKSLGPEHPTTQIALANYKSILSDMKLSDSEIEARLKNLMQ